MVDIFREGKFELLVLTETKFKENRIVKRDMLRYVQDVRAVRGMG